MRGFGRILELGIRAHLRFALPFDHVPSQPRSYAEGAPENMPPEKTPSENMPPEKVPPENMPPEKVPPENMPPEKTPPEKTPSENMPPENMPPEKTPPAGANMKVFDGFASPR